MLPKVCDYGAPVKKNRYFPIALYIVFSRYDAFVWHYERPKDSVTHKTRICHKAPKRMSRVAFFFVFRCCCLSASMIYTDKFSWMKRMGVKCGIWCSVFSCPIMDNWGMVRQVFREDQEMRNHTRRLKTFRDGWRKCWIYIWCDVSICSVWYLGWAK